MAADDGYVRAEFESAVFGLIDDVEWVIDAVAERIDYRSASRVGYYDFGANRRRMRRLNRILTSNEKIFPGSESGRSE